ncbi:MAG: hypothetical protein ABIJ86_16890 [Spirochaetota bacterium]
MRPRWGLPVLAISAMILLLAGCVVGGEGGAPVAANESIQNGSPKVPPQGQAVLIRGSESVRGIAGFGRNAIPALFGEYAFAVTGGETQVLAVWFTREVLVLDEAWSALTCPGLPTGFVLAQSRPSGDDSPVLVASAADYRIVIRLPPGFGNPCRFTAVLIERFIFFIRNAVREEDISFPAFLQL